MKPPWRHDVGSRRGRGGSNTWSPAARRTIWQRLPSSTERDAALLKTCSLDLEPDLKGAVGGNYIEFRVQRRHGLPNELHCRRHFPSPSTAEPSRAATAAELHRTYTHVDTPDMSSRAPRPATASLQIKWRTHWPCRGSGVTGQETPPTLNPPRTIRAKNETVTLGNDNSHWRRLPSNRGKSAQLKATPASP